MVGIVGEDQFGPRLKENFANHRINVEKMRVLSGQSIEMVNILIEKGTGAKQIMLYPRAVCALEPTDFMMLKSLGSDVALDLVILQLEIWQDTIKQAIETANQERVEMLLNPLLARYFILDIYLMIAYLVINKTKAILLLKCKPEDIQYQIGWVNVAEYFLNLGVKNIVVTLGKKGTFYSNMSESGFVEAEKNWTVIDTLGARCVLRLLLCLHCPIHVFSLAITNISVIEIVL